MSLDVIRALLEKHMQGTITRQEEIALADLLKDYSNEELYETLEAVAGTPADVETDSTEDLSWQEPMLASIRSSSGFGSPKATAMRKPLYRLHIFRYAAAVLLFAVAGSLWYYFHPFPSFTHQENQLNKAKIVVQTCGLRLPSPSTKDSIVQIHIVNGVVRLTIPESWQYMLTLPDDTQVWLNAATTITYPFKFKGASRKVKLEGEAYFMVKNSAKPFYITANGQQFLAPNSSFNINAYEDRGVARIDTTHNPAWKEGYFAFQHTTTKEAVGELARWYGWKIVYDKDDPAARFDGSFCRNTSEAAALDYLKASNVYFKKQGNQITIYN